MKISNIIEEIVSDFGTIVKTKSEISFCVNPFDKSNDKVYTIPTRRIRYRAFDSLLIPSLSI